MKVVPTHMKSVKNLIQSLFRLTILPLPICYNHSHPLLLTLILLINIFFNQLFYNFCDAHLSFVSRNLTFNSKRGMNLP